MATYIMHKISSKAAVTLLAGLSAFTAGALTVNVTPGSLSENLDITRLEPELALSGSIDARDLNVLRELRSPAVETLDLSDISIAPLTADAPTHLGKSMFKANHLPAYILFKAPYSKVVLPRDISVIEDGALAGSSVTEIEIPEGVTYIGAYAFYGCRNLRKVTLPTTLLNLGRGAFAGCPSLESVNLADTRVSVLPEECFSGDVSLRELEAPGILTVESRALAGSGVESLSLPQASRLAPFALADMYNLLVLSVSPQTRFSEGALMNCNSLMSLNGTPEDVPDLFAANCGNLPAEQLVASANSIGKYALANSGVTQILLGNNLTAIDENAFKGAFSLSYIDASAVLDRVPDADATAFAGLTPPEIILKVDNSLIDEWRAHPVWGRFKITSEDPAGADLLPADESGIRIRIQGNSLIVEAPQTIQSGAIYDLGGNLLLNIPGGSESVTVDISGVPSGVNLVSVRTADSFKGIKILL